METYQEILKRKIEHYGKTEAAYEFAAEEFSNMNVKEQLRLCGVLKPLPSDDKVFDKAKHYIESSGIINDPRLSDEVFKAYKYGCFWMRRQLK